MSVPCGGGDGVGAAWAGDVRVVARAAVAPTSAEVRASGAGDGRPPRRVPFPTVTASPHDTAAPTQNTPFCHVLFASPQIPPNTGNAIRMCAGTGAALHLAEPLGFNFEEKHVRRAGLDYHDLAEVHVHPSLDAALARLVGPAPSLLDDGRGDGGVVKQTGDADARPRVFAFTAHGKRWHTDVDYRPGDVLLFGPEPTGLSEDALADPRVTEQIRIPMIPGRRSMNLSNAAAVAAYEVWRQMGFPGGK